MIWWNTIFGKRIYMNSIIIVNYNGEEFTRSFLESLRVVSPVVEYEIIVVDNCSTDGSNEIIQSEYPEVLPIQQDRNEGFGNANNVGACSVRGEYLFIINNDTLFTQDALTPLSQFLETDKTIGIAAPMLLHQDGSFQHANRS